MKVTVIYPVSIDIEVDLSRLDDDEYIEQKQEEAKNVADKFLEQGGVKPVIHDADAPELVE